MSDLSNLHQAILGGDAKFSVAIMQQGLEARADPARSAGRRDAANLTGNAYR